MNVGVQVYTYIVLYGRISFQLPWFVFELREKMKKRA